MYEFSIELSCRGLLKVQAEQVERIASVLIDEWCDAGYSDPLDC